MMKKVIFYIVLCFFIFNTSLGFANEVLKYDDNYEVRDFSSVSVKKEKKEGIIKSNNSFATFLILPFLIDKLYPDEEIYEADITSFLSDVYPNTNINKIDYLADVFRAFVISKREYRKMVNRLKHQLKVKEYIPDDAKVVAKDGEFVSIEDDLRKKSFGDEYNVSNNLHKYAEYASGELGNPVKRRDKNFQESPEVDELVVALFEFDIRGIVNAISKMPKFNDGSAEKPFVGDKDLRARILLDTYKLGDKDKIKGVIEVNIPKGYYIKGDFIDESSHPFFVLKENKDIKHNIKDYHFYFPMAYGVEKDYVSKRVFGGNSLFPFEITRADKTKGIYFGGDFNFLLCDENDECIPYITEHGIRIKTGDDNGDSIYYNYVTQAHTHLPKKEAKGARLKEVFYNKKNKKLDVVIETDKKFSNVAVMVEDDKGTNFVSPKYQIRDDVIVASFEVIGNDYKSIELSSVGVSASFDDKNTFRVIKDVNENDEFYFLKEEFSIKWLFWLGVLFNIFPGMLFIFLKSIKEISSSYKPFRVCLRYIGGLIFSVWSFYEVCNKLGVNLGIVYFSLFASMIVMSSLIYCLGYMDFLLFRPLGNIFKKGLWSGVFMGTLLVGFPYIGVDLFSVISEKQNNDYLYQMLFAFGLGLLFTCFIGLFCKYRKITFNADLKAFNLIYGLIYLLGICWFLLVEFGWLALFCYVGGMIGLCYCWYFYPIYLGQKIKGKIKSVRNIKLFYKIQFMFLGVIVCIYIFTTGGVLLFRKNEIVNNNTKEIYDIIEKRTSNNAEVLVGVVSKWSFKYLIDKIILQKHSDLGLKIIYVDAFKDEKNANYWLEKFDKKTLPLYVLYTKRHKNGLVLPNDIGSVNFYKAVKNF